MQLEKPEKMKKESLKARLIEQSGNYVGEIYTDAAISGAFVINRPDIRTLLEDARRGKFDGVMAEALDRISRDQEEGRGHY